MKRLAIKKLIVISQSESRSLEVPFENGLNIILGGNKTGKSSIIKSIFTTLGCECKRIETDWKKLISAYLLFFKYGEKQFCVVRQGKKFQIFENNEDSYSCIIETETFHEYSNCLMDILEIKMPCISKDSISIATEELEELKEKYNGVSLEIQSIEQKVRNSQQLLSYFSFYKNKGQYEIYESCKRQLEVLQGEIDSYVSKIAIIDEKINEKKSKERSKDIREDIEGYCRTLADAINLPKTFIKLRDFVQIIDRTGSETPRLVYMYQSALYLYNLYRTNSPFNFYVVDTPNQQGQDAENLGSIFKSLELFLSDAGQVIVGTERETGLEGKASNVIKLTEKRRCLNTINYSKHLELLEELQKTAISWVAFNHKAKNEK